MTLQSAALPTALLTTAAASPAQAVNFSLAAITGVGVHNAYQKDTFSWMIDALESGASMLEIDLWQNFLGIGRYSVSHWPLFGSGNNCSSSTTFDGLRSGERNQNLATCLRNMRLWHDRTPEHPPLVIKLEAKNGFDGTAGFGPAQLDTIIADALGADNVLKPADVKGTHPTLDAAVRAGNWPDRDSLRGKFVFLLLTGVFEESNPLDRYDAHHEYADHLTTLDTNLHSAMMFPTINGASAADPRIGDNGGTRAQWYVTFDGAAKDWFSIDNRFYVDNHYLVVMSAIHEVPPAIDGRDPAVPDAHARIRQAAAKGATIVSSDWSAREVVSFTIPRGQSLRDQGSF
ncbi:Ca2+-dependent phosphoinositide-specific phospholipase C [Kibdelosporangium aridum]|uniref:Phosphoinositide phospholipase C, Ca2+-dependent n=1 Tax=Kibdelosporangium aridum TaxID=2030 RepID=A0A1Y5Y6D7_KIBAR|nr:Ca2+-dependent phosphoinositide-specific phospholipase C [Kibdelosporangium aridum]SMD26363.1 Phosphoinositide phospholipase C, Ca2+-dependent [Kibdelosporangium aridum]